MTSRGAQPDGGARCTPRIHRSRIVSGRSSAMCRARDHEQESRAVQVAQETSLAAIAGGEPADAEAVHRQRFAAAAAQPWEQIRGSHGELAEQLDELGEIAPISAMLIAPGSRTVIDDRCHGTQDGARPSDRVLSSATAAQRLFTRRNSGICRDARFARHNLLAGQVRLGEVVADHRSDFEIIRRLRHRPGCAANVPAGYRPTWVRQDPRYRDARSSNTYHSRP